MRRWGYGINNYHKTASIYLETAPWPIFAIEWLADFICDLIPLIPLPDIKFRLKDKHSIVFNGGEWVTAKEWWGDTHHLFHDLIHNPIFSFCYKRTETKDISIDYEVARDFFYKEDKELFDG